ncbi:uncharacterized protein [Venturia canescens]|uniref:uncharacterized protein isoform X2 n=1 Tax=Venturia canescens TaxID=32260 RepID=UPI001C9C85C3|nr:uncharacterized protein LOC122414668 isoform X2 [Venturia canescens]
MGRSAFSVTTILVLANFILISSAKPSHDFGKLDNKSVFLNEVVSFSDDLSETSATRFIGDLFVGQRYASERLAQGKFDLDNQSPDVLQKTLYFDVKGTIHYLSLVNDNGSYLVVCETPYTLGSSVAEVNVRLAPYSTAHYSVIAAFH